MPNVSSRAIAEVRKIAIFAEQPTNLRVNEEDEFLFTEFSEKSPKIPGISGCIPAHIKPRSLGGPESSF